VAGVAVANLCVTAVGTGGGLAVFNQSGSVVFIVDVFGYWS
jgi:hypothetical protein